MQYSFLCFISVLLLFSCDAINFSDESEESSQLLKDSTGTNNLNALPILLTDVDQLRLRRYPDIRSDMLTTFDENTPIYFTGEQTDFDESIGGRKGHWKRVKTIEGEFEGWVFGAEHFVTSWLEASRLDSLHQNGTDIRIINNLSRSEMQQLTGANFNQSARGTRYSGYYEYDTGESPQIVNGSMLLRARQFDADDKQVIYKKCSMRFNKGMPSTELICVPLLTSK